MKIMLLLKQVPEATDIKFDSATKTIVREGVRNGINAYDRRALAEAIRLRQELGAEVVAVTMGPPQAKEVLLEALFVGVDRAVHILDSRLAGSDTLATARVLAAAARRLEYDLILAGQHSTDSETGQVPFELAELLGVPCAAAVRRMDAGADFIRVECETDEGVTHLELPLPAVVSAAERLIKPIKTKDLDFSTMPSDRIETLTAEDLGLRPREVGFSGSPTWVSEIREQLVWRHPEVVQPQDAAACAARILEEISRAAKAPVPPEVASVVVSSDNEYWCLMERFQGRLRPVSLEMLAASAELASKAGGKVCAILLGPAPSASDVEFLDSCGADLIYHAPLRDPHPDAVVALMCDRIQAQKPFSVLLPSTSLGKALAARIAARLQLGLTGDCIGLEMDEQGRLQQWKPAFGGNIVAPIYSKTLPNMATVRPGALPAFSPRAADTIPVVSWNLPYNVPHQFHVLKEEADTGADAARMDGARVVIGVGMGLGQENVALAIRLADAYDGAICATRRVVDAGWLPRQYQVGLTGKFIAPAVYVGFGISGRYNHTIGIQKAGKIIAINQDPAAEIFKQADLGVVADCSQILRALVELVER